MSMIAAFFTILISVAFVAIVILLGWFLIWKAFLSKFRLVRELLGQVDAEDQRDVDYNQAEAPTHTKVRKVRKD